MISLQEAVSRIVILGRDYQSDHPGDEHARDVQAIRCVVDALLGAPGPRQVVEMLRAEVGEPEPLTFEKAAEIVNGGKRIGGTPPAVKLENGELIGWAEFEGWAVRNIGYWHHGLRLAGNHQCTHEQAVKLTAYLMTMQVRDLSERLLALEMIAPRKVQLKDGTVKVYRCPDDLVPLQRFT